MKKIDGHDAYTHILLPLPPELENISERDGHSNVEMDVYVRFMRCLRRLMSLPVDEAILWSVQIVADMIERSASEVSHILVNLGLRAPRMAFPESFLEEIDLDLMNEDDHIPYSYPLARDLSHHWQIVREDRVAHLRLSTG